MPGALAARIHSLNILRHLLRDATTGAAAVAFVGDVARLAIAGFDDDEFAIRNSSLMVFSAIVARVFGVKRVRDDDHVASKP